MDAALVVQAVCTATGSVLAGPAGGITGSLVGRLLPGIWPWASELIEGLVTTLTSDAVKGSAKAASEEINRRISPAEKQRINHDLQTAFRDAFREALYDVGGAVCFPQAWGQKGRDVPSEVVYPLRPSVAKLWRDRDPLAEQVSDCLQGLNKAWSEGRLLPLEPPSDQPAGSVYGYLDTDQPQALADSFFEQVVAPHLTASASLWAELPDLQPHLRRYLLDRTLVHLGENLKKRPEAWRAFNRLMLEGLREQLGQLAQGQATVLARLDDLAKLPTGPGMDTWAESMADLISSTGRIERRLDEGFDSVLQRATAQHREEIKLLNKILDAVRQIVPPPLPQPHKRVVNTSVRPDVRATFRNRTAETAWLRSRLADPDVRLISIVGRGGYGKTALVSRVAIEAESGSLSVDGGSLPVAGVAYFSPGRTGLTLDRLYADLRALLGEPSASLLAHRWQDPAATIEQKAYFLLEQIVRTVQEDEVLLVVVDGMEGALDEAGQVADGGLCLWLEACLESGGPIRLIVTSRQEWLVPDEAMPHVREYNLEAGLEESDGVQVLRDLDPEGRYRLRNAGEALLAQAVRQTGGVPFALTKIAGLLRRDPRLGLATLLGDATIFGRQITLALAERCLSHLSPSERQVMEVLAVVEKPVPSAAVGQLSGEDGAAVEHVLDELARSYLVAYSPGDSTWALHDIDAQLVCAQLGAAKEAALHRRAGEFWQASEEVGDRLKAARHFQRAGEHARAAPLAAANVNACINAFLATDLRAVLESFAPHQLPVEQWVEVCLARGELYDFLGEGDGALASYQEGLAQLETLPDSPQSRERIARACRGIARLLERESPDQALEWLRRGLDQLAEAGGLEEALSRLQMGSLLIARDEYAAATEALRQTLDLVPADALDVRARALNNLGVVHCCQGDLQQGGQYYQQALAIFRQVGERWGEVAALHNLGMIHEYSGDWSQAAATYEQALELAERLGDVERRIQLESSQGILETKRGEYDSAAVHLARFLELAGSYRKEQMIYAYPGLADLQIRRGALSEAEESIGRAEQLALEMPARSRLVEIYRLWAELRLAQGKPEEAVAFAEKAVGQAGELEDLDPLEEGAARRALGQALWAVGQVEPALAAFDMSLQLLEERDPYEAARTRMQWGKSLLAGGEVDRGTALLRQAGDAFAGLGAARDAAAVEELLAKPA